MQSFVPLEWDRFFQCITSHDCYESVYLVSELDLFSVYRAAFHNNPMNEELKDFDADYIVSYEIKLISHNVK